MTDIINTQIKIDSINVKITKKLYQKDFLRVFETEDLSKIKATYILNLYSIPVDSTSERTKCLNELNLYQSINHKNIMKLKAYQEQTKKQITYFFFLLETYNGISLSQLQIKHVDKFPRFSENAVWNILYDIAQSLNYLHYHKFIHRAVTLDNIFLCNDGLYKLGSIKYSINSKKSSQNEMENKLEQVTSFLTEQLPMEYRCPEFINPLSVNSFNEKVDVFSLGVCLYSLMFNQIPFNLFKTASSSQDIIRSMVTRKNNNHYSLSLLEVLLKMLSLDTESRISISQILDFIDSKITKGNVKYFIKNENGFDEINKLRVFNHSNYPLLDSAYSKLINLSLNCKQDQSSVRFNLVNMINLGGGNNKIVNLDSRLKYIKFFVKNLWSLESKERIVYLNKLLKNIMSFPLLYDSEIALLALSCIDHIFFLSPNIFNELFQTKSSFIEYLDLLITVWKKRQQIKSFDANDKLGVKLAPFLIKYSEAIKNKIKFLSKYSYIEPNYTISKENITTNSLLLFTEKIFINDMISLYSTTCYLFIELSEINESTEEISLTQQIINEQIVTISKLAYILLLGFKLFSLTSNLKGNLFDSRFIDITKEIKQQTDKESNKRILKNSKYLFFDIPDLYISNFQTGNEKQKFINEPNGISQFYEDPKSFCGVGFHSSVNLLIQNNHFDSYQFKKFEKDKDSKDQKDIKKSLSLKVEDLNFLSKYGFGDMKSPTNSGLALGGNINNNNYNSNTQSFTQYSKENRENNSIFNTYTNINTFKQQNNSSPFTVTPKQNVFSTPKNSSNLFYNLNQTHGSQSRNSSKSNSEFLFSSNTTNKTSITHNTVSPIQEECENAKINNDFNQIIKEINPLMISMNINNLNISSNMMNKTFHKDITKIASSIIRNEENKKSNYIINSKDISIEKQIGFGGTSEVTKGIYRGSEVAVKKLRIIDVKDDKIKEFKREIQSLSLMRNPHLILFMGAIAEPNNISIVTEYCSGGTLFNLLHSNIIFPWALRIKMLYDISIGMNFLHTNNPPVIHRDLKSLK